MNQNQLSRIVLRGFKSIRECDLELKDLNVLIGANGSGKSNFISFFRLIHQIIAKNLQYYVKKQGGIDAHLHFGRKKTKEITGELYFGDHGYKFSLEPTLDNRVLFSKESYWQSQLPDWSIGSGHFETNLGIPEQISNPTVLKVIKSWRIYHFHDTSETASVKTPQAINDNIYLRPDAQNLAAYLYLLKNQYQTHYQRIVKTIQLVAPFFGDFCLRPAPNNQDQIELEWFEKGEDVPFKAYQLSDGTLRFICLATVLMQPEDKQPEIILIDEPELGLHPYAINVLASLLRSTAKSKQVIVSTQSVALLNEFDASDVIVCDRIEGATHLHRLDEDALAEWLEEYSLGELWQKNLLGGRPSR
ncbi:AAA family ATPase [Pseudanabaena sp. ABRG5-3]|uniref:AAA family ATPase n=1 Tax=Pseudanabaena sp. ABRG5-3 TaxID=685565 RepID=UPI000DC72C66|nr:AAA family ATPase [Pseudanabaena sp. ABRG5-3]BBC26520.1 SMC domain-containing protein [Pseudanabaena sp. ABRG5-3]